MVGELSNTLHAPCCLLCQQIKRPYFHAKPLDKHQLQNWHNYLDFEVAEGDHRRTVFLFERCIIACAMYEEFWLKVSVTLEHAPGVIAVWDTAVHCEMLRAALQLSCLWGLVWCARCSGAVLPACVVL